MIGTLIKAHRILPSRLLFQSERWLSCIFSNNIVCNQSFQQKPVYIASPLSLPNVVVKRQYSIGEYDKLWQAVSSGRGSGRGGKKKVRPKDAHGEFLKFASAKISFPGLNTPVSPYQRDEQPNREVTRRVNTFGRGWAGKTWPGRHVGAPEGLNKEEVEGFDSIVIEVKRVATTKANGRNRRFSAIVVVGNKNGSIGWAIGKAPFPFSAIKKAKNKAVNYLHYIPICDGHTIYHDLRTKVKSTEIKFERRVAGHGRRCQRIVSAICELAGIEDIRCKIIGITTPLTVVRCAFQGLKMQETHQELADRIGKNVVEYRLEQGNRPIVVASPSLQAVNRRMQRESQCTEEDITIAFDPHRGAHRPKSLKEIQGDFSEVLVDTC